VELLVGFSITGGIYSYRGRKNLSNEPAFTKQ
jgi:hypothetical protein